MKNKEQVYDLGKEVKILYCDGVPNILKVMSKNCWLQHFPKIFIDLINNEELAIQSIKYAPNIYFSLDLKFKKDKRIIRETISAFKNSNRIQELNTNTIPLTKRKESRHG